MSARRSAPSVSFAATVALALGAASCGGPLDEVWQLREFRVLGVRLDPPEAERGARVNATLYTADPRDRTVRVAWIASPFPIQPSTSRPNADAGSGVTFAVCLNATDAFPLCPPGFQCACGPTPTFTVPPTGGLRGSTGKETITLLGYACAGGELRIGSDLTNPFSCLGDGSRGWSFTRTIVVRDAMPVSPLNVNPRIREVRFGPAGGTLAPITLDAPPHVARCADAARTPTLASPTTCPKHTIEVFFEDGSRQAYNDVDPVAMTLLPRTERLSVGFIVSGGRVANGFRTDSEVEPESAMSNDFTAPDTAQRVRLLIYASDRRGGFDATERAIVVD